MHWRTPFPPRRPSVLAELMAVVRTSLQADQMMAAKETASNELPDELEPSGTEKAGNTADRPAKADC